MHKHALLLAMAAVGLLGLIVFFTVTRDRSGPRTERARPQSQSEATAAADAVAPDDEGSPKSNSGAAAPPVDLSRVDLDRDVHGVVADSDGVPIAGAELVFVTYPWRRISTLSRRDAVSGPSTVSASDGSFALRLRRGRLGNLRARAKGYAPVEITSVQAGERVDVELAPGVVVVVRTVDEGRRPVAGTTVRLHSLAAKFGEYRSFRVEGTTDQRGEVSFENLPAKGKVRLETEPVELGHPRYDLPESGSDVLEVVLPSGWTVTGHVIDARTTQPIAGARVGMGSSRFRETTTDDLGRYVLEGWTGRGYHTIWVDADGYGQASETAGDREVVDFALQPGGGASVAYTIPTSHAPLSTNAIAARTS